MAWNEPGNGKDPWQRGDDKPTNLDDIVLGWQRRLSKLFGSGGNRGGSGQPGGSSAGMIILGVLLLGAWIVTGFYRVDEAERGIVQRFGAYTQTTLPGLRWHWPFPIESVALVNTIVVSEYSYKNEMLTADEQYVFIDMTVQYRREDPVNYSFEVVEPELTLRDVTESALREVVGISNLDTLVTGQREEIASRTLEELQTTLDRYQAGIRITSISLEQVTYPTAVQGAVDDAQKARNDRDRAILDADAYSRDVIARADGQAARITQDAEAYRDQLIANAEGEAARFEALLTEYRKAPRVTRDRLYIEAIEEVYGNSNKVLLDSEGSGNLLYLPIDKLINNQDSNRALRQGNVPSMSAPPRDANEARQGAKDSRERRTRQ
jgi:membrane protease subunit HflK